MAGVRTRRGWEGLVDGARESAAAPLHIPSAGELFVKELAAKQTDTKTSLREQLAITQNFVSGETSHTETNSVQELCRRSGLSRQELESHLSVKPNSEMARLYKFALSNSAAAGPPTLLQRLTDHPLNNLKSIEQEMMEGLGSRREQQGKKRKHRARRKKVTAIAGCSNKPVAGCISQITPSSSDQVGTSEMTSRPNKSLWDIEGPVVDEERTKKLFTVQDGVIVQVRK